MSTNGALQNVLTTGYWSNAVKNLYESYMLDGETVSIYFQDNSEYYTNEDINYMKKVINDIDNYIDLDFELTNDFTTSDIDIFLEDRTYQDYLGLASLEQSWISLNILWDTAESYNSNLNTFTHEFMHALGIGEPGFDLRWDQDDTAMSYNPGQSVEFRTSPSGADLQALLSLWGAEDDSTGTSQLPIASSLLQPSSSSRSNQGSTATGTSNLSIEKTTVNGRSFLSNEAESLTNQSSINIGLLEGDDFLEITGGVNNYANGNNGADNIVIKGGAGRYLGGSDNDRFEVTGAEAGTWVNGNRGQDLVIGGIDGVTYRGGSENDTLQVSAGNVWGDLGADTFQAMAGQGVAVVQDYTTGEDVIKGIAGGSFTATADGLVYRVGNDQMLLLVGISDASQVTVV